MKKGDSRENMWTDNIALGSEHAVSYRANFGIKNEDIGGENSYFVNDSSYISKQ